MNFLLKPASAYALAAALLFVAATPAFAHCDAEDGPVIKDARVALEKGDVAPVLKWIGTDDEEEIRALFAEVAAARKAGNEAKSVADRLFFETLVRLHRAGEGAPFDGVKPAGHQEPFVATIDRALAEGGGNEVAAKIGGVVSREIAARFDAVAKAATTKDASAEAGRAYVASYVELMHFVKRVHEAVETGGTHAHSAPADAAPADDHSSHAAHGGAR